MMTPYLTLFCADIVEVYNSLILLRAIANTKKDVLEHIRPGMIDIWEELSMQRQL